MYESGTWTSEWADKYSNFREADNLVTKIEALVRGEGSRPGGIFIHRQFYVRVHVLFRVLHVMEALGHYFTAAPSDLRWRLNPSCDTCGWHTDEGMGGRWAVKMGLVGRHDGRRRPTLIYSLVGESQ